MVKEDQKVNERIHSVDDIWVSKLIYLIYFAGWIIWLLSFPSLVNCFCILFIIIDLYEGISLFYWHNYLKKYLFIYLLFVFVFNQSISRPKSFNVSLSIV